MNYREAYSWLSQPGVLALMPVDKDTREALKVAMKALEKQMPMKTEEVREEEYVCPSCGAESSYLWMIDNYCPECGQRIIQ
mgnify:CR=1 FL=1